MITVLSLTEATVEFGALGAVGRSEVVSHLFYSAMIFGLMP
jgi:hypothetical protein